MPARNALRLGLVAVLAVSTVWAGEPPPLAAGHRQLECRACHPAPDRTRGCTDGGCHRDVAKVFLSSEHDRMHVDPVRLPCTACHGSHPVVGGHAASALACTNRADRLCLPCHEAAQYRVGKRIAPPAVADEPGASVHAAARQALGCSEVTVSCFTCHGSHTVLPPRDPESPVNRFRVNGTCGSCHERELEAFARSVHARGLERGDRVSPTCVSCHGSHGVLAATGMRAPTAAPKVVFTCAECHEDPAVLRETLLPLEAVDTYEESLHGIAYRHGIHDVANCATCHGFHDVLPAADPRSPVNPANIRDLCLDCHERVTPEMIEAVRHPKGRPGLRGILERIMVYFPIAGTSVNPLLVSGMGALVGFLSGIFGVGGGFLMTPLLIFIGIPAAVAAATDAAQITAGASSGAISHARLGNVDFRMGLAMVAGSWPGGWVGVQVVHALRAMGNFDFFLKVLYVLLLGFTGVTMLVEGARTLRGRSPSAEPGPGRLGRAFERLPLVMNFPKSRLRISVLVPMAAGFIVGILAALLGVGGGFILMPMMIYIIGIPTLVAVGTGLFQIVLTCAWVTLQQSLTNHTVDVLLAIALFAGSVIGAQFGVLASRRLKGEQIRVLLAIIVLAVMGMLLYQLVTPPDLLIQFARSGGGHR